MTHNCGWPPQLPNGGQPPGSECSRLAALETNVAWIAKELEETREEHRVYMEKSSRGLKAAVMVADALELFAGPVRKALELGLWAGIVWLFANHIK